MKKSNYLYDYNWRYYFQILPGEIPELFGENDISVGIHEHHLSVSPDYTEMFFVIADKFRVKHFIVKVKFDGLNWSEPEVAKFSGVYSDFAPTYSHDGNTLYFCSNRPIEGNDKKKDFNIWIIKKNGQEWGIPEPLPFPVNDDSNEYNPTVAENGNIYFQDHDKAGVDIYFTEYIDGKYSIPKKLPIPINSKYAEIGPLILNNETILLFSSNKPDGYGYMDYYISKKMSDGNWGDPVNMGDIINTPLSDGIITISPDKKYFFFTRFDIPEYDKINVVSYKKLKMLFQLPAYRDGTLYWVKTDSLLNK